MAALREVRRAPLRPGERVEIAVTCPETGGRTGAILFGPHPLLGGDLENNVMTALAQAFAQAGHAALRFNYRSVGRSEAGAPGVPRYEFWAAADGRRDFTAALEDGAEAARRAARLFEPAFLVGYSFGAYVALQSASRSMVDLPLALICPPLGRLDFAELERHRGPTLLILAEQDAFDPPPPEAALRERFPRVHTRRHAGADHFFLGDESAVAGEVLSFCQAEVHRV